MSIRLADVRHHLHCVAEVLEHLSPKHIDIALSDQLTSGNSQQGYVSIHRSQLIIEVSAKEKSLSEVLVFQVIRHGRVGQCLNQRVGAVDTLITLRPEDIGHVTAKITHQVKSLHQLIVCATATKLVVTGQTSHIEIRALRIGMCSVQIFIDTSKYSHTIFLCHGEVLSGQTANIHHIVNVT